MLFVHETGREFMFIEEQEINMKTYNNHCH